MLFLHESYYYYLCSDGKLLIIYAKCIFQLSFSSDLKWKLADEKTLFWIFRVEYPENSKHSESTILQM